MVGLIPSVADAEAEVEVLVDETVEEVLVGGVVPRAWQVAPRSETSLNVSEKVSAETPYLTLVEETA